MYMYISVRNFFVPFFSCIIYVRANFIKSQSTNDFIDAFNCLGSVVQAYKSFSNGCAWNIDVTCSNDEISCLNSKQSCKYWRKFNKVKVSFSLQLSSSIFINDSKELTKLSKRCYCEEYFINCSVNSEILINNLVHEDTCITSPLFTSTTKEATRKLITTTLSTGITTTRTKDSSTKSKNTSENKNSTCLPELEYLKDSTEYETEYGAIFGALLGGIVLGAAVEFLITTVLRRAKLRRDQKKDTGDIKLTNNPAYDCSSLKVSVEGDYDEKPMGHLYTQITHQNQWPKVSQSRHGDYENSGQKAGMIVDQLYNHLNEKEEIDRADYYDHAGVVQTSPQLEDYGILKSNFKDSNAYTEVVGEGFKTKENHHDLKEKKYLVLEKELS